MHVRDGRTVPRGPGAWSVTRHLPYPSSSMATAERDYYVVLGVERTATDAEIKRAFRKLAQQWHPGRQHGPRCAGAVQGDQRGLPGPVRSRAPAALRHVRPGGRRRRRAAGCAGSSGFGGFSDIFDAFFGGGAGAGAARRGRPQPGADLRYDLRITFEEAVKGTEKEIEFPVAPAVRDLPRHRRQAGDRGRRPARSATAAARSAASARRCSARWSTSAPARAATARARSSRRRARPARATAGPSASGRSGSRSRPASTRATRSGSRTRARSARAAAPPAACTWPSTSQPHPSLKRDGTELYYEADVSIAQAALGTQDQVPTVDGEEEVEIKPGTQPDTEIRLRGKGVPHLRRAGSTRRPARAGRRRRPDQAVASAQRELLRGVRRGGRRAGRLAAAGCARSSGSGDRRPIGRRRRRAPGSSSPSRPTSRRSRRSARSSAGSRPAARPSSRRSTSSTRGSVRGSTRPGRRSSGRTCRRATGQRPTGPSPRLPRRSVTSRRSACGRSASSGRGSSTRRTGPRPGRRTSRSCASAGGSSSGRPGGATAASPTTSSSPSTRGWPSGPACTRRPGCASPRSRRSRTAGELAGARVLDVGCGSGILAIAAVKLGRRRRARRRHRSDRDRGDRRQRAAQPARAPDPGPRRAACRAARRRSMSSSRTSSRACWCRSPPALRDELRPGRDPRRVGHLRRPRGRGARGVRGGRLVVDGRRGRGRLGRARGHRRA